MKDIINLFAERVEEIDYFFSILKDIYATKETGNTFYNDDRFLVILKSNTLLMIYNLVESTIMGGILEIYGVVEREGYCYQDIREEIQRIWFEYKFNEVYQKNTHHYAYQQKAKDIVDSIINSDVIKLDRRAIGNAGNLDFKIIRSICKNHGIKFSLSSEAKGGNKLYTVKNKRNNLAHGSQSFSECGGEYTLNDLNEIKNQTYIFLSDILSSMEDYYNNKLYLANAQ
jgi:hypothetical protein